MAGCTPPFERAATDAVGSVLPQRSAFAGTLHTAGQEQGPRIEIESSDLLPCLLMRTSSNEKPIWILPRKDGLQLVSEKIDDGAKEASCLEVRVSPSGFGLQPPPGLHFPTEQNATSHQAAELPGMPPPPQHAAPTVFRCPQPPPPPKDAAPTDFGLPTCPAPPDTAAMVQAMPASKQLSVSTVQSSDGPCHKITWTIPNAKQKKKGFDVKDRQMISSAVEIDLPENGKLRSTTFRVQIETVARNTSRGGGSFKTATEGKISLKCVDVLSGDVAKCKVKMSSNCSPQDVEPKAVPHNFAEQNKCDPEKEGHFSLTEAKKLDTFIVEIDIMPSSHGV